MAGVAQKTLQWLYDVLRREYRDPNRAYSDLAQTLSIYPGFAPRTDVYTSEKGVPALLLNLKGTLPVNFRGTTYRFPIAIWIPHAYPYESPIVYVTPTDDMVVRQGQHVSGADGKIYHHYLANWGQAWDRSNLVEFLKLLADVFAKEPPVVARPQGLQQQIPRNSPGPPPLPRPPVDRSHQSQSTHFANQTGPPPPPPKQPASGSGDSRAGSTVPSTSSPRDRYSAPPPLPPPAALQGTEQRPQAGHANEGLHQPPGGMQYMPQRATSQSYQTQPIQQISPPYRGQSPVAHPPSIPTAQIPTTQRYSQAGPFPQQQPQNYSHQQQQPPPHAEQRPFQQQYQQGPQSYQPSMHQQPVQPVPQQTQPKPVAPKDLLSEDDPFQVTLPTATQRQNPSIPAPPIPENPEKTALLAHLSHQILQTLHQSINQTSSTALPSLQSQHNALTVAQQTLTSELQQLQSLSSQISSNISSLQSTINSSSKVISSTTSPSSSSNASKIPSIDEIIIPPSVISRQLYDNVAEQRGYEAATYALNEAFVRGRIGTEVWVRRCREMAREEFRRKWMIKRIGAGLGLEGAQ